MRYRLERQKSGALAVYNTAYAETMHPGAGPWAEANALYVQGSALAALLLGGGAQEAGRRGAAHRDAPLVLFDVGLGAAANALAAVTCRDELARRGARPRPLHLVSFEAELEALAFTLAEADALGYPRGQEPLLRDLLRDGRAERDGLRWEVRVGDFRRRIEEEPERAEVIYFDPFSPRANPELWSLETLEALHRCRPRAGGTRLVTYSTAFGTRAGLLLAGFFVGEGPLPQARRAGTCATTWFADLARPLTPAWLARWRHDREPWPPLTPPAAHRALRERLLEHPQWAQFPAETPAPPEPPPARRSSRTGPGRTGPRRAESGRTEPSRTEPSRTEPSRTEPSRAETGHTEPSRTGPSRVARPPREASHPGPRRARPRAARRRG
jgi:tRNA U34 5-methylaminomethyl-2-thiouridine-forming methyltransferase MnmC